MNEHAVELARVTVCISELQWRIQRGYGVKRNPDRGGKFAAVGAAVDRLDSPWSLRLGILLEDRPRYTPTTTLETCPFPAGLTPPTPPTSAPSHWQLAR